MMDIDTERGNIKPILKGKKIKTRILRPSEFVKLTTGNFREQRRITACLLLGARYEECRAIQKHPEWFDGNFVKLPSEAQKKVKQRQSERWIRLSLKGKTLMPFFFEMKPLPTSQAMNQKLKKMAGAVGIDPVGLTTRSLRKTYESWLVFYYPTYVHPIYLSQGHSDLTSLRHYQGLPFLDDEKGSMKEYVEGWV